MRTIFWGALLALFARPATAEISEECFTATQGYNAALGSISIYTEW
jgi:hypothetical protein